MHEVDDDVDVDVDAASAGFVLDAFELVVVAVDQHDPAASPFRIPPLGLVEHGRDHLGGGVLQ
ncbi:hypothetical protein [Streptomyces sasae]|uniref:hypothetical protein n=1 Tax=Streptomyces sasae TaxID=1266772 RepID=UPI00292DFA0D|nr:hypothetical protein [Streptomyces sasae]